MSDRKLSEDAVYGLDEMQSHAEAALRGEWDSECTTIFEDCAADWVLALIAEVRNMHEPETLLANALYAARYRARRLAWSREMTPEHPDASFAEYDRITDEMMAANTEPQKPPQEAP